MVGDHMRIPAVVCHFFVFLFIIFLYQFDYDHYLPIQLLKHSLDWVSAMKVFPMRSSRGRRRMTGP
ncbi:hypothetical protein BDW42DRAFT_176732 [Aspergillus taichungensis]|uniref:Uncharacterized protein n=1 Tax=Aspergillus taichungensis TaxID=482145 RepID=A0A2J5HK81_9EURO|nr:hypothetical protein BDW42DRAFT_176732 [Aspergillus taichungensis]